MKCVLLNVQTKTTDNAITVLTTEVKTTNKTKNVVLDVVGLSASTLIEITSSRLRRYSIQL